MATLMANASRSHSISLDPGRKDLASFSIKMVVATTPLNANTDITAPFANSPPMVRSHALAVPTESSNSNGSVPSAPEHDSIVPTSCSAPLNSIHPSTRHSTLHDAVTSFLSLPPHTTCPLPLSVPLRIRPRSDPPFLPTFASQQERHAASSLGDEWSLHPLLISQIKSVRPETTSRPYCDWFASERFQICRLAKFPSDSAWDYTWSAHFHSWVCPPFTLSNLACAKFIRDSACGTVILSDEAHGSAISQIRRFSSIIFRIKRKDDLVSPTAPNLPRGNLSAFILDTWIQTSTPQVFHIALHPDWLTAFRHSPSNFKVEGWRAALERHPDSDLVNRLCDGITWGRSLGFTGDRISPRLCTNRHKATLYQSELAPIIEKERSCGFRSGPFRCPDGVAPPLFNIKCHPRSAAIKKSNGKVRLVIDMSAPYDGSSVNANCPSQELHYVTLDNAGSVLKTLGKGTLLLKFDVVAAYKQIRLIIDDWCLQGETYEVDGVQCFDISTAANFGAKSSGFIWEEYGGGFEFAIRWSTSASAVLRYVDDFLTMISPAIPDPIPDLRSQIQSLADSMGIGLDKFASGTSLEFLGIIVDTEAMCFRIPQNKKDAVISDLKGWRHKAWCTKRSLDSLIGSLQYLTRVIPWGRAFLGRCIRKSASKSHPKHRINLNTGFRLDIAWWLNVLPSWNGISLFYDDEWTEPLEFEVDASLVGHGCFYHPFYYSQAWSSEELLEAQREQQASMPYLELLAIARACSTFGSKWAGKRILCRSDCEPASSALSKKYSKVPQLQHLIRLIGVLALSHNFDIRVKHIASLHNIRADPLSRLRLDLFDVQVAAYLHELSQIHPAPLPTSTYELPSGTTLAQA